MQFYYLSMSREANSKSKKIKRRRASQPIVPSYDYLNPGDPGDPSYVQHRRTTTDMRSSSGRKTSRRSTKEPSTPTTSSRHSSRHRLRSQQPTTPTLTSLQHHPGSLTSINLHDDHSLVGAAYQKGDVILTKDTGDQMCVIKTVRSQNGLQYGIIIPPESSSIRYIKPNKVREKLQPETLINRLDQLEKAHVM